MTNTPYLIAHFRKAYGDDKENIAIFDMEARKYELFILNFMKEAQYGANLRFILIQYHISTSNNLWDFDYALKLPPLKNYSSKEKAISVIIPVILEEFLKLSPQERKQKFSDDAMYAVKLVKERLEKKKLDIDFNKLISDLERCNEEYLK